MVQAREANHLEVKELLLEVGGIPKGDGEPNAPEGDSLDFGNDPKEGGSTRAECNIPA